MYGTGSERRAIIGASNRLAPPNARSRAPSGGLGGARSGARQSLCLLTAALSVNALVGCYSYSYHRRSPAAPNSYIAIDENRPLEQTRWSYFWGLLNQSPVSPVAEECDGRGAGKVAVTTPWYGVPLSLLTLGMASPSRLTLYCSTESPPPPSGP